MGLSILEFVVVACGLTLLVLGLLSLRMSARRPRQPMSLAPIGREEILAIQREAEAAALDTRDNGSTVTNPYPVGTRARIIWETTFHSMSMD